MRQSFHRQMTDFSKQTELLPVENSESMWINGKKIFEIFDNTGKLNRCNMNE